MLGLLMDASAGIAICGTHGKSTTSGWLAFILEQAHFSPSFIIGADVPQLGGSSGVGEGGFFVAEACEYDRSFLNLHPKIMVMLNIEQDHLDYYKDEGDIVDAFGEFADCVRTGGLIIANGTDANVATVLSRLEPHQKYVTFGLDAGSDFYADNIELVDGLYHFDVCQRGNFLGRTKISLPGEHNILNALAVVAAAVSAGAEIKVILPSLGQFAGVDRRLMLKARAGGVTILDDYAHHPTEIKASLRAIRQRFEPSRIWCVFQPHQYSRTRFLLDDFAQSFKLADVTIVPQIYFVRDTAEAHKQINARILVDRIRGQGCEAVFIDDFGRICEYLKENVKKGDLVVTMGAGDIWKVADEYIQGLGAYSKTELSAGRLHMVRPGRKC
jgi:UDP-N-acetylmuramate--alanine ligase